MTSATNDLRFLGLEEPEPGAPPARVAVLPVPLERTTSYGQGTREGPRAILQASRQVELWDEEQRCQPHLAGIETCQPCHDHGQPIEEYLDGLRSTAFRLLSQGRFVLALGGEHTLTQALVAAARDVYGDLGVVQFDAHADLRDRYQGTRFSHACVMRRVHEMALPTLSVGVRSLSPAEARYVDERRPAIFWGHELADLDPRRFQEALAALPHRIYLTFDVDFFDPSLLPATGTPEPGGGAWRPTLSLLRALFAQKEVVGMDLVELSPDPHQHASDFTIARLAFKCLAYLLDGPRPPGASAR